MNKITTMLHAAVSLPKHFFNYTMSDTLDLDAIEHHMFALMSGIYVYALLISIFLLAGWVGAAVLLIFFLFCQLPVVSLYLQYFVVEKEYKNGRK